jgi:hypothetical protein
MSRGESEAGKLESGRLDAPMGAFPQQQVGKRKIHASIYRSSPRPVALAIEFKPYWLRASSMTLDAMDPSHDNQVFS